MAFFIGNSFCRLCQVDEKQLAEELLLGSKGLSAKGLYFPRNAIHSAKLPTSNEAWIIWGKHAGQTQTCCIKVDLKKAPSNQKFDKELVNEIMLHAKIYEFRPDVNSICHTKNPYTIYATLNGPLEKVHGEAALILGDISIVDYSCFFENDEFYGGEKELEAIAGTSIGETLRPIRIIILKGNSVFGLGACIHEARAFVEILEEWSMFIVFSRIHGGPHHVLTLEQLRSLGARYARSIKFGGRQISEGRSNKRKLE